MLLYVRVLLLTYVPPLSSSQAWRDLSRTGKSRAGDVFVMLFTASRRSCIHSRLLTQLNM